MFARTSKRRSISSTQYGPSVMVGVTATVAAFVAAAAGAAETSCSSAVRPPLRPTRSAVPTAPAAPSASRLVILCSIALTIPFVE